jgi:hypothetical protein
MEPELQNDALLLVAKTSWAQLALGDFSHEIYISLKKLDNTGKREEDDFFTKIIILNLQ